MVNSNFVIHATCPLTFMVYKYSKLEVSFATQKLSCKTSCKTPFSHNDFEQVIAFDWLYIINIT